MRRILLALIVLVCAGTVAFAGGQTGAAADSGGSAGLKRIEFDASSPTGGQIVPPTDTIYSFDAMFPDGEHWPGDGVWEQLIKEKLNLDITVRAHPWSGYGDKLKMFMVSDSLPEVVFTNGVDLNDLDNYGMDGGFVSFTEWMDILPNIRNTFFEEYPEVLPDISASNGEIYRLAHWGTYAPLGISGGVWSHRADMFEKLGVEAKFDTYDDLYETAKKLKAAAPEYYPIGTRNFRYMMAICAWAWGSGPGLWGGRYYDPDADVWKNCYFDPGFKEMIQYFAKLYKEELLHPEIATMNSAQFFGFWVEPDKYQGAIIWAAETPTWDMSFNGTHATYPGAVAKWFPPPVSSVPGARAKYQNGRVGCWSVARGHAISAKAKNPEALVRWLDYWYSEEGKFFSSWGTEGVIFDWYNHPSYGKIPIPKGDDPSTYATENDFYNNFVQKVQWGTGFGGWGPNAVGDKFQCGPPYMTEIKGDIQAAAGAYMYGPAPRVYVDAMSREMASTKETDLGTYASEAITQFVLGKRSFDEWDEFIAGVKERDAELVLDIYNRAWQKTKTVLGL